MLHGQKVPPPTKAEPTQPAAVKKPVFPPNAAMASTIPGNVLKEDKKPTMRVTNAPPLVAERPAKKAEVDQVDDVLEQDGKDDEVKVEANKKAPLSIYVVIKESSTT